MTVAEYCPSAATPRLLDAAEQDGAGIERRLGRKVDRVCPGAGRGVGAVVVDLIGDCEVLAGRGVGGDGERLHDEVGGAGDGAERDAGGPTTGWKIGYGAAIQASEVDAVAAGFAGIGHDREAVAGRRA